MIVIDTHALLWWTSTPERLGRNAAKALARSEQVFIPAIVFWEIATLARRGRISELPAGWTNRVSDIPGVVVAPIDREIAVTAANLDMHGDPADRFIVATAMSLGAPLVTKDERIRALTFVKTLW